MRKTKLRGHQSREQAAAALRALRVQQGDAYGHYRELYSFWCSNNAAVLELRPLFKIPSITTEFKERVRSLANELLPAFSQTERKT